MGLSDIVLALDPAWGGTGWALCNAERPIRYGRAVPSGHWRWSRMDVLCSELRDLLDEPARMVIEIPPNKHQGVRGRANRKTLRGLSMCVGALIGALGPHCTGYPWELQPQEWRAWWGLQRGRRDRLKAAAVMMANGLGASLDANRDGSDDVAEAVLLGVGAAQRLDLAPKGPTRATGAVLGEWT